MKLNQVIEETIKFLRNPPTIDLPQGNVNSPLAQFEFSITDFAEIITGSSDLKVFSVNRPPAGKKYFLKSSRQFDFKSNISNQLGTFTVKTNSSLLTNPRLVSQLGIKYKQGNTTKTLEVKNHLDVVQTASNEFGQYNEYNVAAYIIYGIVDPANPNQVVTLRIRQYYPHIGG